jgi:hypothetical protein
VSLVVVIVMALKGPSESGYRVAERYNLENVADPAREELIFGERIDWENSETRRTVKFTNGDVFEHDAITPETVRQAAEAGYLSLDQRFNASPEFRKMVEDAEAVNDVAPESGECRLIGYVVSPNCADCRITIEGGYYDGPVTPEVRDTFKTRFGTGYEFSESDTHLRRWHD